jgi:hypothetical protein
MISPRHRTLWLAGLCWLASCTGLTTVQHPAEEPDQAGRTESFWRYGHFCGRNYPSLPDKLPVQEEVRRLLGIAPVDDVDLACQFHDVCYAINGKPSRICDKALSWNLQLITPSIAKVRKDLFGYFRDEAPQFLDGCTRLISEIEHFAQVSSAVNAEDVSDMIVEGLGSVVSVVVSTPGMLLGNALGRTELVAGAQLSPCVTSDAPSLLFPISTAELNALRGCYQPESGFTTCAPNTVTARGRGHQATAEITPTPAEPTH